MNSMTHPTPIPPTIADAIEAMVHERVVAALATEKDNRLAMMVKLEGDAFQRGYAEALSDVEAAWGAMMARLWAKRDGEPVAPAAGPGWPWEGGAVVPFCRPMPAVPPTPTLTEWDLMLAEQGAPLPLPYMAVPDDAERPLDHIGLLPDPEPPAEGPNLYDWPEAALAVLRRQWPRYVTEREVQNEVEGILLETTPIWKIRAQAKAMSLAQPPMPRLAKGAKLVEVTWHQAAMLARGYGIAFTGDMQALNQARISDSRLPCLLTQHDGPTAEDVAAYGPATL